jgi:hypothetical protein
MATHRYLVLAICCMSLFIVGIDNTIVNVALPTLNRRINASTADLQDPVLRRLRELAAGAHSPVRSEIKDFGPGRS